MLLKVNILEIRYDFFFFIDTLQSANFTGRYIRNGWFFDDLFFTSVIIT